MTDTPKIAEVMERNTDEWVKRADYNRLYQEFDAKCRAINEQSAELTQARAEIARLRGALGGMLAHSCVADSAAEDKLGEDYAAESAARAALQDTTP